MYAKHFQLVLYKDKVFDWDGNLLFKETDDERLVVDSEGRLYKRGELVNFILENIPAH
jgi:hypothetical protein